MKKNLFLILFLAVSVIANAAITSGANFQLLATTSGATDQVLLLEDDSYALSDVDQSATKVVNHANPTSVNLYVSDVNLGILAQLGTSSLKNTPLTVETNKNETSYKIKLLGMAPGSRALKLYDLEANNGSAPVAVFTSTSVEYPFTAPANSVVTGRFYIDYDPSVVITVTTNEDGWASFAFNADLAPVEAPVIYKGALDMTNPDAPVLNLSAVADIPAGEGVFIHGTANTEYHFNTTTATADMTGNDIEACVDATPVSAFAGDAIYTLRYANGATALYQYVGLDDIPAHKAVLPIVTGGAPAPARIALHFAGEQGIDNVEFGAQAEKFVENGQIFIKRGEVVYNMQGQIVK